MSETKTWISAVINKVDSTAIFGKLQLHTMVSVNAEALNDKRQIWYTKQEPTPGLTNCVLLFGGVNQKKRINNDLWLIEPDCEYNRDNIFTQYGEFQSQTNAVYIKMRKLSPQGRPPLPRFGHAACIFKGQYMVIHGGRNDNLMKE